MARIQGVPVESHLGEFREAEENLRNAEASWRWRGPEIPRTAARSFSWPKSLTTA